MKLTQEPHVSFGLSLQVIEKWEWLIHQILVAMQRDVNRGRNEKRGDSGS